jgi:hypothetical protein
MLPRLQRLAMIGALSVATLSVPSEALAFERSTVTGDPSTPLWWRFRTVPLRPAYDTCDDLDATPVGAAIARSIATWNASALDCSDFGMRDDGYPTGFTTNLTGGRYDGENRIVWRESVWPEEVSEGTLALTTLVFRRSTGEILDADIDLNGVSHRWTDADDPTLSQTDVENTVTHELGHLLGLAHVADPEATMYAQSDPGDLDKRTLAEDDLGALCFIYPTRLRSPGAPYVPGEGLNGCAASRAPASKLPALVLFVLGALSTIRRRRGALRAGSRGGTACASSAGARRRAAPSRARSRSQPRG